MSHFKAVLFDVRPRCLIHWDTNFFQQIGGVVVQSPLLALHEYEIEHGIPHNYINCSMFVTNRICDHARALT